MAEIFHDSAHTPVGLAQDDVPACLRKVFDAMSLLGPDDEDVKQYLYGQLDEAVRDSEATLGNWRYLTFDCGVTACEAACTVKYGPSTATTVQDFLGVGRIKSLSDCIDR